MEATNRFIKSIRLINLYLYLISWMISWRLGAWIRPDLGGFCTFSRRRLRYVVMFGCADLSDSSVKSRDVIDVMK